MFSLPILLPVLRFNLVCYKLTKSIDKRHSKKYNINLIQKYNDKKPPLLYALSLPESINEKISK
ncbi:MAG: hypothetical protein IKH71_16060, partial [Oscillospiraceae bacterium]|nr:hypothetical protein [Oscillospiraceae bacterium]